MSISSVEFDSEHCRSVLRFVSTAADQAAVIIVPTGLYRNLVDHMWRSLPHEGVGLLATSAMGTRLVANHYYAGTNTDRSATRYTMDPLDVSFALSDMRRRGARLGAIVHSHPQTPPVPSVTDLAAVSIPGVLCLIVGLTPLVHVQAWNLIFSDEGVAIRGQEVRVMSERPSAMLCANAMGTIPR